MLARISFAGLCTVLAFARAALALPPDGQLDPAFNGTGIVLVTFAPAGYNTANLFAVAQPGAGKLLLLGESSNAGEIGSLELARLLSSGVPDPDFGDSGIATITTPQPGLRAVVPDADGGTLLIYTATGFVGTYGTICRTLNSGALDPGYGNQGCVTPSPGSSWGLNGGALQTDGSLVVAGFEDVSMLGKRALLARIGSNGTLDTGFAPSNNGFFIDECAYPSPSIVSGCEFTAVTVARGGRIYADGEATSNGTNDLGNPMSLVPVYALTTVGVPDSNFGPAHDGRLFVAFSDDGRDRALSIALSPAGRIVASGLTTGSTDLAGRKGDAALAIVSDLGQVIGGGRFSIGTSNDAYYSQISVSAFQADGKLMLAGTTQLSSASDRMFAVDRLTSTFQPDANFGASGHGALVDLGLGAGSSANAAAIAFAGTQPLIAGTGGLASGDSKFAVIKLTAELIFADGFE